MAWAGSWVESICLNGVNYSFNCYHDHRQEVVPPTIKTSFDINGVTYYIPGGDIVRDPPSTYVYQIGNVYNSTTHSNKTAFIPGAEYWFKLSSSYLYTNNKTYSRNYNTSGDNYNCNIYQLQINCNQYQSLVPASVYSDVSGFSGLGYIRNYNTLYNIHFFNVSYAEHETSSWMSFKKKVFSNISLTPSSGGHNIYIYGYLNGTYTFVTGSGGGGGSMNCRLELYWLTSAWDGEQNCNLCSYDSAGEWYKVSHPAWTEGPLGNTAYQTFSWSSVGGLANPWFNFASSSPIDYGLLGLR